jgi:hypothetical protein
MLDASLLMNLDGQDPTDLVAYGQRLQRTKVRRGMDNLTRELLLSYAFTKAEAMNRRAAGDMVEALRLEFACYSTYHMLPRYARW